jgi:hypothetical protein
MSLTPYDTGQRLEPMPWHVQARNLPAPEEADRYGKVDFDNEESVTIATLWIERRADGTYAMHVQTTESIELVQE